MKRNVDLTLDRKFSRINAISVHQLFEKTKKPWEPNPLKTLMSNMNDTKKHVVLTGSKKDRAEARYYQEMPDRCDRCGNLLNRPWKRCYGLCKECNDWLKEECNQDRGAYIQKRKTNKYKNFKVDTDNNLILNI